MKELRPVPKPEKPRRGDRECREYLGLVAQLPCVCCGAAPVECHHPTMGRFAQRKASDLHVIPLCPPCHRGLHADPESWRGRFGADTGWVEKTRAAVDALRQRTIGGRS